MHDLQTKFELEGKQIDGETVRMLVAEVDFCGIFYFFGKRRAYRLPYTDTRAYCLVYSSSSVLKCLFGPQNDNLKITENFHEKFKLFFSNLLETIGFF